MYMHAAFLFVWSILVIEKHDRFINISIQFLLMFQMLITIEYQIFPKKVYFK